MKEEINEKKKKKKLKKKNLNISIIFLVSHFVQNQKTEKEEKMVAII